MKTIVYACLIFLFLFFSAYCQAGEKQCSNARQLYISKLEEGSKQARREYDRFQLKSLADLLKRDKISYITYNDFAGSRMSYNYADAGITLFVPSALAPGGDRILEEFLMDCIKEVAYDVCISPTFSNCNQMGCDVVCKKQ